MQMLHVLILAALVVSTPALADPLDPPLYSDLELDVLCDVTAPTHLLVTMHIAEDFGDRIQGLRIDRSVVGQCDSTVELEARQIGVLLAGTHQVQWFDDTAEYGVAYQYRVRALDANGDPTSTFPEFEMVAPVDYATCGDPVIAHGWVYSHSMFLETCPSGCWSMFSVSAFDPLLAPYVDTGVAIEVTGSVDCRLGNVEGCALTVESVTPEPCPTVAVERQSWGAVKSRF